jgi:predicted RecA/RadA family phage recombinase
MNKYVQPGEVLPLTAPSPGVVSGTPVTVGSIVVVPAFTAATGVQFSGAITGTFLCPKVTGGGTAWTEGVPIYWDASAGKMTKSVISDTGDHLVGVATAAAGDSAATGYVRFDGVVR